jgi:hypothetical protein
MNSEKENYAFVVSTVVPELIIEEQSEKYNEYTKYRDNKNLNEFFYAISSKDIVVVPCHGVYYNPKEWNQSETQKVIIIKAHLNWITKK